MKHEILTNPIHSINIKPRYSHNIPNLKSLPKIPFHEPSSIPKELKSDIEKVEIAEIRVGRCRILEKNMNGKWGGRVDATSVCVEENEGRINEPRETRCHPITAFALPFHSSIYTYIPEKRVLRFTAFHLSHSLSPLPSPLFLISAVILFVPQGAIRQWLRNYPPIVPSRICICLTLHPALNIITSGQKYYAPRGIDFGWNNRR